MKDQYGNEVPKDLIALERGPDGLTDAEVKIIVDAQWYEVTHSHGQDLAVSFSAIVVGMLIGAGGCGTVPPYLFLAYAGTTILALTAYSGVVEPTIEQGGAWFLDQQTYQEMITTSLEGKAETLKRITGRMKED